MSPEHGQESCWVDGCTVDEVFRETVRRHADRDAVAFPRLELRWTWRQFDDQVEAAARGLRALGLSPGEHVAVWATNVPEWVVLQFATARIGAVLVTINPAYRPFELEYVLNQSDCVALFLVDRFKSSDYFEMLNEVCPDLAKLEQPDDPSQRVVELKSEKFPRLRNVVAINGEPPAGVIGWDAMIQRGQQSGMTSAVDQPLNATQAINIQYTSGTTGFPKAAMLSHRNLLLNAFYVGQCQRLSEIDRICIPVPFYHCFGCVLGTLCSVVYGAAMVVPAEYYQPQPTLQAIAKERATVIYGVPTMFIAELEHKAFPDYDLSSLRTGIMAGSPCPIEVMRAVVDRMGAREMTIAYGQTEASPVVTQTRTDDPLDIRVETVGSPIPGVEIKVIDPETGKTLNDNEQGELCSRGHVVMIGYYKNPDATAAAIDGAGWLHSGDLAVRLPNGNYRITGRIKDMVIRGGENIYPREIEEFLFTHADIEQASVVGVPDLKYGEELCAWIKTRSGSELDADDVRSLCRKHLAHFKVPRYVEFVEAFPQTVTGKIQKFKIREQMIESLGLDEQETA